MNIRDVNLGVQASLVIEDMETRATNGIKTAAAAAPPPPPPPQLLSGNGMSKIVPPRKPGGKRFGI